MDQTHFGLALNLPLSELAGTYVRQLPRHIYLDKRVEDRGGIFKSMYCNLKRNLHLTGTVVIFMTVFITWLSTFDLNWFLLLSFMFD